MAKNFHEQLDRPEAPLPSDRSTGFVFAVLALIVAYLWRAQPIALYSALGLAAGIACVSVLTPGLLRPLNIAWMRFAQLLSKIMNPIVLLLLYAVAIVPTGLIMQLVRDPLRSRRQPMASSYWIERSKGERSDMSNQF